ncbi:SDR family oxidoreductase [Salinisphaera sp. Q1T1-3]|uniref:SDR family oxidoreductase n=1 Tax=Salinisphaera sp. Q1T1-3 TaxID=2321229 RepID=UPI000E765A4C|nr:SDR family oxidoreductase [Salinisphaera sp. Q1T1-3]RJS93038.1 SDR family oxidoreductase [Salinisphaera sp. Q1T1-3]
MTDRLHDKTALITGAASGIGAAIADRFVAEGARVALVDRNEAGAGEVAARLNAAHPDRARVWAADVTDAERIAAVVAEAQAHFGRLDILINGAGVNVFAEPTELSAADWRRCLAVNLEGAWHAIQAVLPAMRKAGYGHIVNIASVHGHRIIPGAFPYPVAKHGLIGLTRSLGVQYAAEGIRVNSISPGLIRTPAAEAWLASLADPEAERARQREILPCKRLGEASEVAYAALFLASDEARFINATDLTMDGGRSQIYHD